MVVAPGVTAMPFITVPAVAAEDTFVVPCFVANDATDDWGSQLSASPFVSVTAYVPAARSANVVDPLSATVWSACRPGRRKWAKFQVLAAVRPSSTFTTVSAPTWGAGDDGPGLDPDGLIRSAEPHVQASARKVRCTIAIADRKPRVGIRVGRCGQMPAPEDVGWPVALCERDDGLLLMVVAMPLAGL